MMTVLDEKRYFEYRNMKNQGNSLDWRETLLSILLFGSMGAITWAIRGTAGWGGVDGTIVPGLTWGMIWYYLCYRKGIDARGIVLWLGLGLALGGELGYGQYVSWIRGMFYAGNDILSINPAYGYLWLFYCGIGWAAPGAIILGWVLGDKVPKGYWIIRSLLVAVLLVFLFAWPFVEWLGTQCARYCPGLLFPHADLGLYSGELGKHLSRTVYTNTQNFCVVLWWLAALVTAVLQKDQKTLFVGLLLGLGFGIGFMQSTTWCLGYSTAPQFIDWWKMWELNAGFNLGLLYTIAWLWAVRQTDKEQDQKKAKQSPPDHIISNTSWLETIFPALAGAVFIFFAGFEYFIWTVIFLSAFYFIAILVTGPPIQNSLDANKSKEQRWKISLIYSAFLLVFLLFHGGSERAGIVFGLYDAKAVDQYAWPAARIILFAPVAIILIITTVLKKYQTIKSENKQRISSRQLSNRMVDLMTITAFIGALSIWPAKISIFYAFFLVLALFAFNRLNVHFNKSA